MKQSRNETAKIIKLNAKEIAYSLLFVLRKQSELLTHFPSNLDISYMETKASQVFAADQVEGTECQQ